MTTYSPPPPGSELAMSESLLSDHDVQSMSVDELSDFLESKGIDEEDTTELASKLFSSLYPLSIACQFVYV